MQLVLIVGVLNLSLSLGPKLGNSYLNMNTLLKFFTTRKWNKICLFYSS